MSEAGTSLQEHIAAEAAEAQALAQPPAVAEPVKPAEPAKAEEPAAATPEQEAESTKPDAELTEAGRTLRKSRADERKAKIQRDIDALKREEYETRDRLERSRRELDDLERRRPAARPDATAGAAPAGTSDPNDPMPKSADFADYEEYIDAKARWSAREEFRNTSLRRERIARHQATSRALETQASKLDAATEAMREKYADFDAVVEPFVGTLAQHQDRARDVTAFLAESEVGGEVAYRVAKDPALIKEIATATSRGALMRALIRVEGTITSAQSADKPLTSAPKPAEHTVGGGASATAPDITKEGTSLKDHIRIEEAALAERRKQGYRY